MNGSKARIVGWLTNEKRLPIVVVRVRHHSTERVASVGGCPVTSHRLDCPETYGTHKCSQLFDHSGPHYCVCVKGEQRMWQDGEQAPLSAFRPDLIKAEARSRTSGARSNLIYLASPYTHDDERVEQQRYEDVSATCAWFARQGEHVYSPIAHWHPIALAHTMPTHAHYYQDMDEAMIRACDEFFVLTIDGWTESIGVQSEMAYAQSINRVIQFVWPNGVTVRG